MREVLMSLLVGAVAGAIDIGPMIKMKLSKYAVVSAFMQWVILGLMIPRTSLFGLNGWINGSVVAVLLCVPIVILVAEDDKKSVPIIVVTSIVLGGIVGLVSSLLGIG